MSPPRRRPPLPRAAHRAVAGRAVIPWVVMAAVGRAPRGARGTSPPQQGGSKGGFRDVGAGECQDAWGRTF
eukprot:gene8790-10084_t